MRSMSIPQSTINNRLNLLVCRHFFFLLVFAKKRKEKNPFSFNPRRARGGGTQWNVLKTPSNVFFFLWVSFFLFGCHLLISPAPDGSAEFLQKFSEIVGRGEKGLFFYTHICVVNLLREVAWL